MKNLILLLSVLLGISPIFGHEYHVAIIDMEYNQDSSSIEVSLKINTNDLNKVLNEVYKKNAGLNTEVEYQQTDSLLYDYLDKNLFIQVDSIQKAFNFIGYEHEEEFTFVYIEYINVNSVSKILIRCSLLEEIKVSDHGHSHQSNLINVKVNDTLKSLYLNTHNREGKLEF